MRTIYYHTFVLLSFLSTHTELWGQTDSIAGIINQYSAVTHVDAVNYRVTTDNPNLFNQGDKVLLIQMKGATYNSANTSSFGSITNLNGAGTFNMLTVCERDLVTGVVSFDESFVNTYATSNFDSAGIQLVTIPQYAHNVLIYDGTLTAQPWNGQTGGVLIFEAAGTVTLQDDIDVSGLGFRGGKINTPNSFCSLWEVDDHLLSTSSRFGAGKGEGIAAYPTGSHNGKGPMVNGGGGGNDHNAGGGGGSNAGTGGQGGHRDPGRSSASCKGENPGLGGYSLLSQGYHNTNRYIFMGGGGGSGHQNNNRTFAAGRGGGIVIITAQQFDGNGQEIRADGADAVDSGGDGGSGGGAGGTILLDIFSFVSSVFTVSVEGGDGADSGDSSYMGPGGGGGGGMIWTQAALPGMAIIQRNGGSSGISVGSGHSPQTHFATSGQAGSEQSGYIAPVNVNIGCILPIQFQEAYAGSAQGGIQLAWQINSTQGLASVQAIRKDLVSQQNMLPLPSQSAGSWLDPIQVPGTYYYQLIATDLQGQTSRSEWLVAKVSHVPQNSAKAYFMPTHLAINGWASSSIRLHYRLYNSLGQICLNGNRLTPAGAFDLQIPHSLPKGVYTLSLHGPKFSQSTRLILR